MFPSNSVEPKSRKRVVVFRPRNKPSLIQSKHKARQHRKATSSREKRPEMFGEPFTSGTPQSRGPSNQTQGGRSWWFQLLRRPFVCSGHRRLPGRAGVVSQLRGCEVSARRENRFSAGPTKTEELFFNPWRRHYNLRWLHTVDEVMAAEELRGCACTVKVHARCQIVAT